MEKTKETMSSPNILDFCRLCLVKENVSVLIFEEGEDSRQIFRKISACLPVKVSRDDELPKKICDDCVCRLDSTYEFCNLSANSEKQLLQWLADSNSDHRKEQISLNTLETEQFTLKEEALDEQFIEVPKASSHVDSGVSDEIEQRSDEEDESEMDVEDDGTNSIDESEDTAEKDSEEEDFRVEPTTFVNVSMHDGDAGPSGIQKTDSEQPTEETLATLGPSTSKQSPAASGFLVKKETNLDCLVPIKKISFEDSPHEVTEKISRLLKAVIRKSKTFPNQICLKELTSNKIDTFPSTFIPKQEAVIEVDLDSILPKNQGKCNENPQSTKEHTENELSSTCTDTILDSQEVAESGIFSEVGMTEAGKGDDDDYDDDDDDDEAMDLLFLLTTESATPHEGFPSSNVCFICSRFFPTTQEFKEHIRWDWDRKYKNFSCCSCGITCRNMSALRKHMTIHTTEKLYSCYICRERFHSPIELRNHKLVHNRGKVRKCPECEYATSHRKNLERHVNLKHKPEYKYSCHICGGKFYKKAELRLHLINHPETKSLTCELCNKSFKLRRYLLRHKNMVHFGSNKDVCQVCGKIITRSFLQSHLRMHYQEKPFQCDYCGKCFSSDSLLKMHLVVHTKEKKFKCPKCDKCFTQRTPLTRHLKSHHGGFSHDCELCEKQFKSKWDLEAHKNTHEEVTH